MLNLPICICKETVVNWLLFRNIFVTLHVPDLLINAINPFKKNVSVVKSRIAVTNAAFNKKMAFQQQIALIYKDKSNLMPRLEHRFVW